MIIIECPWCGARDMEEFTYVGDGTLKRPDISKDDADPKAWHDFTYLRDNPRGPHVELWHHAAGCRQHVRVKRDTLTHEVHGCWPASGEMK